MTPLLLAVVVKSLAVLLVAVLAVMFLRRASAAARHVVWLCALVGILMLPLLSALLPVWQVTMMVAISPVTRPQSKNLPHFPASVYSPLSPAPSPSPGKGGAERLDIPNPLPHEEESGVNTPGDGAEGFAPLLFVFLPAACVLLRWCLAFARIRRVGTRVNLLLADELACAVGVRRRVEVRLAPNAAPMTWGWRRPVMLLPAAALDWPVERLRVVLLHELAHVKRCDWLAQLVGQLACAVYWFLPPVWLAARQLRLESEQACDDVVLSVGIPAPDYAGHLLEVLRTMKSVKTFSSAALPMASPSTLETRVRAILSVRANRRGATRPAVLLAALLAACIVVPLAALQPVARAQTVPPAAPKKPFVVAIDAGHGGQDSGAVFDGIREKDLNLDFARRLRDALRQRGATVVMMRDSDIFLPTLERPKLARNARADVFVSLHCETNVASPPRSGVTIFQHDGPQNAALARRLAAALGASSPKTAVRVQNDTSRFPSGFGVLRLAAMPAVLIECGDLSNPQDMARLQSLNARDAFAYTLADALCQNAPQTESRWRKSLPGGGSVTLFAVSKSQSPTSGGNILARGGLTLSAASNNSNIWKPDGTPLKTFYIGGTSVFTQPESQPALGLLFAVNDPTKALEYIDVKTLDPSKPDVFSVQAGSGQWKTQAIVSGLAKVKTHTPAGNDAQNQLKTTRLEITTTNALLEQQYRMIAIDKTGKMHEARYYIPGKAANGRQHLTAVWDARNLAGQNIREYQFQARPYQWLTFDKIASQPN